MTTLKMAKLLRQNFKIFKGNTYFKTIVKANERQ